MKKELEILGLYSSPVIKDNFIRHIHELVHVKCIGTVTLSSLEAAMLERFADSQALTDAAKDFISFQVEDGGANSETLIFPAETDDEITYFVFDAFDVEDEK
ncbi:hypothetical protein VXS06_14710 [Photobacterium toruni]|uniref:Uncharacterized protein n=1 Tax=Photobacterium toruni TaxID=1935446 RepID=A0ABU6L8W0_9GAMM|nr:hypothetical protein [Photobacterium toruni]